MRRIAMALIALLCSISDGVPASAETPSPLSTADIQKALTAAVAKAQEI